MQIWIDADACPGAVKQIVIRAAERTGITATFVANQAIQLPSLPCVKALQVSHGYDEADNEIVRRCEAGDLVITSDLPLAFDALQKGAQVISPRGEKFTDDNIKAHLNMRDFMETMRSSGVSTGGPPAYSQADKAKFANQFDRILARAK